MLALSSLTMPPINCISTSINGADEILDAKHHFEQIAAEHNIQIKEYHGDNGVYASQQFKS
jgi:hypothetical protein